MLRLSGAIDDQVVVTMISTRRGLQVLERINDRRALMVRGRSGIYSYFKPDDGDRVRALLIGTSAQGSEYFLLPFERVSRGCNTRSMLSSMMRTIEMTHHTNDRLQEFRALRHVTKLLGAGTPELLEFYLDLLDACGREEFGEAVPISYNFYFEPVEKLIDGIAAGDPSKRIEYYLRAAQYCGQTFEGGDWAGGFLAKAALISQCDAPEKLQLILDTIELHDRVHFRDVTARIKRLLAAAESSTH